jgi:hypothetical protein
MTRHVIVRFRVDAKKHYDVRSAPYAIKPARLLKEVFKNIERRALRLPSGLMTASTYFSWPSP